MISFLSGIVIDQSENLLMINVNGIGYSVNIPSNLHYTINEKIDLLVETVWNAENGPKLFGFSDVLQKKVFNAVLSCHGCGPKIGLAILSEMTSENFINAILTQDIKALSSINGIGPKKADSIILYLKDKFSKMEINSGNKEDLKFLDNLKNLQNALQSLGYTSYEITRAMNVVKEQNDFKNMSFDELFRKTLGSLSKKI
ncbi:Holliday junction branch migration protein RuvA [Candidatus Dependentiae bacterium]|nr:Holliday junction branch migration protein RuvA [Candidatus Dependentiae bacterium]